MESELRACVSFTSIRDSFPAHVTAPPPLLPSLLPLSRALGDPDFKRPRQLVENEPDVARVVLKPGRDTFIVLGR